MMKTPLVTLLFSLWAFSLLAQSPIFKLNYTFLIDKELLAMDEKDMDDTQKTIAATAAMVLAFQDEGKPIAQVWVNKNFVRAKANLYNDSYDIIHKNDSLQYTVYPSNEQYYVVQEPRDKLLQLGSENMLLTSEMPVELLEKEKEIAGYTCKLAQITFGKELGEPMELQIWYTPDIPNAYWGEYAYLKNIPGAALEISTNGFGITVSNIELEKDLTVFDIPSDYAQVDTPQDNGLFSFGGEGEVDSVSTVYELGNDLYAFYDEEASLYGIMDSNSNVILEPSYVVINTFENNIAVVSDANYLSGAINLKGEIIIPLEYESLAYNAQDDTFVFLKDGKYGIFDSKTNIIIPNEYDFITSFKHNLAMVSVGEKYGLVNLKNEFVVPAVYSFISDNTDKHFICYDEQSEKYILYAIEGQVKKASYDYIYYSFQDDIFVVMQDGKSGYINGEGKVIVPIIYAYAGSFVDGKAEVMLEDRENSFYINTKGEEIK